MSFPIALVRWGGVVLRRLPRATLVLSLGLAVACSAKRPLVDSPSAKVERPVSDREATVEMELDEIHLTYREDGTWKRIHRSKYRILSQQAVDDWGYTQAYYSPWFTKKPKISVTVTNPSGQFQIDPKLLSEEPAHPQAPDVYGDSRIIRGPLPNVAVGSVIDEVGA